MSGAQQADQHVSPFIPLFTSFSVFSKAQRTIPSWLAYVSPRASHHSGYHTAPTTHQAPPDTRCSPNPSCSFLTPSFPQLCKPFCPDPSSPASPRPHSACPEACFLIPRHRTLDSRTSCHSNVVCASLDTGHIGVWSFGPLVSFHLVSSPPGIVPREVSTQWKFVDFSSISHPCL